MEDAGMTTSWQKEKPPCYLWVHSSSLFCSTSTSLLIGIRSWIQLCHPFFATWGKPNSWGLKGRRWEGKICPQSLLQSFQTPSSSSSSPISPPDTHPNPCTLQIKPIPPVSFPPFQILEIPIGTSQLSFAPRPHWSLRGQLHAMWWHTGHLGAMHCLL